MQRLLIKIYQILRLVNNNNIRLVNNNTGCLFLQSALDIVTPEKTEQTHLLGEMSKMESEGREDQLFTEKSL